MRRENSPRGADQRLLLPRRRPRARVGLPHSRLQPRGPPGMGRGGGIQTLAALLRTGRLHRRWLRDVRDGTTSANTGEPVTWRGRMSSAEDGRRRTTLLRSRGTRVPRLSTAGRQPFRRPRRSGSHGIVAPVPRLRFAHGGAFNQDWRDEWTSVDEVLSEALADHPATRSALLFELLRIRETCSEADVVDLLESMGSGFRPEIDAHLNALGWVHRLVDRINALDATHE